MSETNLAKPPVGLGHMSLTVADVDASRRFYTALGLRVVGRGDDMSILELRGAEQDGMSDWPRRSIFLSEHRRKFVENAPLGCREARCLAIGEFRCDAVGTSSIAA